MPLVPTTLVPVFPTPAAPAGVFRPSPYSAEDWQRIATRYDRRPKVFLSAVALAVSVIFWLSNSMSLEA